MSGERTTQTGRGAGSDRLVGRVLVQRYELLELVARGAMGKIYRARQLELQRECAIKVLDIAFGGDQASEFSARFFREASVAAQITHPNVVSVFDYGLDQDDVFFLAMEFLKGRALDRAMREEGRFPWPRAIEIATQVGLGLRAAHAVDVVHRDLKPANIFLVDSPGGREIVKVVDFGLAKLVGHGPEDEPLTQAGTFLGSARYASPEQIRGGAIDGRTDVYALGAILYEMITGKPPYDGPNEAAIMIAHLSKDPPPFAVSAPGLSTPGELEWVVLRALAAEPADRFPTVDAFLDALQAVRGDGEGEEDDAKTVVMPPAVDGASTLTPFASDPASPAPLPSEPRARRAAPVRWPIALLAGGVVGLLLALALRPLTARLYSSGAVEDGAPTLNIEGSPGLCVVAIDGVAYGPLPVRGVTVDAGTHTVTCTASAGQVATHQLQVFAGQTARLAFTAP